MKNHDLIVIGTGSGNSVIDSSMADWDIGLTAQRRTGGTCLNYGCIPTKMFAYTAEVVGTVGSADDFGVDAKLGGMRLTYVRERVFGLSDRHSDEGRETFTDLVPPRWDRTNADGVYALGDVSTPVPLKHVANREADAVPHKLPRPDTARSVSHDNIASAWFTEPQMASVGMTEEQCRDSHPDYRVGRKAFSDIAYGWSMQEDDGFCEVLVDGNRDLILGAHVIGPQAATLLDVSVAA